MSFGKYRPITLSFAKRLPLGEANFTPFWEGSTEQNRYAYRWVQSCWRSLPAGLRRVSRRRELANPKGWKISVRNCPNESTTQKYTVLSSPKAVMVQKCKAVLQGRGFYPNFRWQVSQTWTMDIQTTSNSRTIQNWQFLLLITACWQIFTSWQWQLVIQVKV